MKNLVKVSGFLAALLCPQLCLAVSSAELYTSKSYGYGRFEARLRFAPNDGVVASFFLWKDGSEKAGAYWNELDFEKLGADCHYQSNAIYGNPSANHTMNHTPPGDLCGAYHTYAYEWTADTVTWLVDGAVIRKETGATAQAFAQNASTGMQFNFINGFAVLSLTADNAVGPAGAMPGGSGGATSGTAGSGGIPASGSTSNASAGAPAVGGSPSSTGTGGSPASTGTGGSPGSTGTGGSPGSTGSAGSPAS